MLLERNNKLLEPKMEEFNSLKALAKFTKVTSYDFNVLTSTNTTEFTFKGIINILERKQQDSNYFHK